MKELLDAGWKWGPVRDIARKINPNLVAWDQLRPEVQEHNRATVRGYPAFLAKAGFQVYRLK